MVGDPPGGPTRPRDIAGKAHWDDLWSSAPTGVHARDRDDSGLIRWPDSELAALLERYLPPPDVRARVLEIGCADSAWLPYLAALGFDVTGLDYSEIGCARARARLAQAGVSATVVHGDAFGSHRSLEESFDAVLSFGVVEHFSDTRETVAAFARFCRPGGVLVTEVPNMTGMNGLLQRLVAPAIYRIHVPLTSEDLRASHADAGLAILESRYLVPWNLGAVNTGTKRRLVRYAWNAVSMASSAVAAWCYRRGRALPPTRLLSPYVVCVASKPAQGESH